MTTAPLQLCVRRTPLPAFARGATRVRFAMPSEVGCIEHAVNLIARHCLAGAPAADRLRFRLQVAVAEALANAVIRGNREDPAKQVHVEAQLFPDRIEVYVTDEGDGFDPAQVPEPLLPDRVSGTRGRGLFLIRKLVDDVRFSERGTSICMTLSRH
ncbi:MAG TPA: ATP-binding protein [Gemmatimonadales bacterium]|nr:ATP-binding protein [Gemmatimonadales bacterium]